MLRASLAGTILTEPAVANNTGEPCNDASSLVQSTSLLGSGSALSALTNLGTVGPAGAYTYETGTLDGSGTPGATSVAEVNALSLNLGGYTLSVAGPIEAQAAVACENTTLNPSVYSSLDALTVTGPGLPAGGETLNLTGNVNQVVTGLPAALSALISIKANNEIVTANSVTEQLLNISLLSIGATPAVNVVIGEAGVSYANADVCSGNVPNTVTTPGTTTTLTGTNGTVTTVTSQANTVVQPGAVTTITGANGTATTVTTGTPATVITPNSTVPSLLADCAPGSLLDSSTGDCVIYYDNQTIFVSKPFKGPTGGTVVPTSYALAHLHSSCLTGSGAAYALIVTAVNGTAKGTPSSDRIIGLGSGEKIEGLAGDDCIDARGTNAKVTDGNGRDRIYVTKGVNRVVAGNGPNVIHGGNGRDWITDGTGNDYIYGGSLPNRIDAYGNEKHIYGGAGNDRIWTNSIRAYVSCGGGKANRLFARQKIAAYGKKHDCQKISLLK